MKAEKKKKEAHEKQKEQNKLDAMSEEDRSLYLQKQEEEDKHEADKEKMLKNQMKEFSSTSNLKKAKPGKRKGKKKKGRGIKK